MCFSYNQACLLCYTLSIKSSSSFFGHYGIKIGKISLDEQAHAQHHPFQGMFRAKGEGGVSERSPNNQLSSRQTGA